MVCRHRDLEATKLGGRGWSPAAYGSCGSLNSVIPILIRCVLFFRQTTILYRLQIGEVVSTIPSKSAHPCRPYVSFSGTTTQRKLIILYCVWLCGE